MPAARETQNLLFFFKHKNYKKIWFLIKHYDKTTHKDTFMPFICKLKGHKPYQTDPFDEPNSWACNRCNRFINYNPRKEKLKNLNKIK